MRLLSRESHSPVGQLFAAALMPATQYGNTHKNPSPYRCQLPSTETRREVQVLADASCSVRKRAQWAIILVPSSEQSNKTCCEAKDLAQLVWRAIAFLSGITNGHARFYTYAKLASSRCIRSGGRNELCYPERKIKVNSVPSLAQANSASTPPLVSTTQFPKSAFSLPPP